MLHSRRRPGPARRACGSAADFKKEVAATGLIPGTIYGGRMPKVVADTVRPFVYHHPNGWGNANPPRFNLNTGRCEAVRLPSPADDIAFDAQGRLYCRAFKTLSRHDAETFAEIPFDYGEPLTAGHAKFEGAIRLNDMGGAKAYQDGFGVGVDGRLVVVSHIFSWDEFVFQRRGVYDLRATAGGFDSAENFLRTRERFLADAFRLPVSPGRNVDSQGTVWVSDQTGQVVGEDLVKGPITGTTGAGIDRDGNVYVAVNAQKLVDGRPFLPPYATGTLVKAPPTGARIVGDWGDRAKAPLDPLPTRPPDFRLFAAAPNTRRPPQGFWVSGADRRALGLMNLSETGGTKLRQTGLLWAYPGVSEHVTATGACTCPTNRFALDCYGRSFVPLAYRFSAGVVDSNGNLITHIGRYGNADSGRGPDSPVKVGGDELAFAFPSFVSVVDGYLFVSDAGNDRIVRVKLGYAVEKSVDLAGTGE